MKLTYQCPKCQNINRPRLDSSSERISCDQCEWSRGIADGQFDETEARSCLVCGCQDLWKQKDFPQRLGLLLVSAQCILSSIAWFMYWPKTTIAILMGFALLDFLLYALMSDVLVCYQCNSRHKPENLNAELPTFNLEVAERYHQQSLRMKESAGSQ